MRQMRMNTIPFRTSRPGPGNERGIALVMALIITLVIFLLIGSTIYVITNSTKISGAGKRYASASEAADGAVEVTKNSVNLVLYGQPLNTLPLVDSTGAQISSTTAAGAALLTAITSDNTDNSLTPVFLNLQGTGMTTYTARIILQRLKTKALPGGRLEFARSAGGSGGTAIYYKINTLVTGPNNTQAENTVIYRFVG